MRVIITIIIIAAMLTLFPSDAAAWGSAAHMFVTGSLIGDYSNAIGSLSALIYSNLDAFMYGSIAPDLTIGKKYCNPIYHSHNWNTAFKLMEKVNSSSEKIFVLGYFSHLAADVAIHQYFIKPKLENRLLSSAMHSIIEIKADMMLPAIYSKQVKSVLHNRHHDLDKLLKSTIRSTLFSFETSKFIFKESALLFPTHKYLTEKGFLFNEKELYRYLALSIEFAKDILIRGKLSPVASISPIIGRPANKLFRKIYGIEKNKKIKIINTG